VVLQVNPATLKVSASNFTRAYGAANPTLTFAASGYVNGDTAATAFTGAPILVTTATPFSPVGPYPISINQGTLLSSNYVFNLVPGTLTVNPATLTVGTQNATVVYGAPYPSFNPTYSGFVNGETTAILSGAPQITNTAPPGATPGSYPVTVALGTLSAPNYTFKFVNGTFTISKPTLVVTADSGSRLYGSANPFLNVTYSGFVNGDTVASVSGAPVVSTTATPASPVASYAVTVAVGTLLAPNYTLKLVNGTLVVTPVSLVVTAQNASRPVASANPAITASFTGFVNGDTSAVVTGAPAYTTAAVLNSMVGSYPIVPSQGSLAAHNYTFGTFIPATLTVVPATPLIKWTTPAAVAAGTVLTATQLNAVATVAGGAIPGTLTYSPPAGTAVYGPQPLNVIFTPYDTVDYTNANGTVALTLTTGGTACVPPSPSLVSWWPGDSNASDLTGGNPGSLQGGVSFGTGKVGPAFDFNGSTGSVFVGDPANLKLGTGITLDAWIYPRSIPAQTAGPAMTSILTKWAQNFSDSTDADSYGLWLIQNGTTVNLFSAIHQTGGQEPQVRGGTVPLNTWTHVAMTYDSASGQYAVYLNGQIVGSAAAPGGIYITDHNVRLGSEDSYIVRAFDGLIDEAQVYSRALGAAEILALYQAGSTGQCKQ
jgi:hypothetical protein